MAGKAFSVTTPETDLTLSADKKASATFTVSNTSGVAILPAKAEIVAGDTIAQDWITIDGEATKHFAISTTHQFTVTISIPETAEPGQYTFRLNMIGIENPDEHFSQGPTVSFVVRARPDQETEPRRIPWLWIGLGTAVLAVVTGLTAWHFFAPQTQNSFVVLSIEHSDVGAVDGAYFHFNISSVDKILGRTTWGGLSFHVKQTRTGKIEKAVLWRSPNGGSVGDGHGRWDDGSASQSLSQWMVGDKIIIFH